MVNRLRAAGETTRMRLIHLLGSGELTVTELAQVLGQSQPRISRHLKLLLEAGLVERLPEGKSVFYRLTSGVRTTGGFDITHMVLGGLDESDLILASDQQRLSAVKQARQAEVQAYFEAHAAEWNRIRSLNQPVEEIEAALVDIFRQEPIDLLIDLGTGTGRMLEVLSPLYRRAVGFDTNHAMLNAARVNLERAGIHHAQVRYGNLSSLPEQVNQADVVVMHHVLHFLENPRGAIGSASSLLKPGGRLVIVDFAPHDLEFLRTEHAHRRLGFADSDIQLWCRDARLELRPIRHFKPPASKAGSGEQLIASLWQAGRPARAKAPPMATATRRLAQ